MITAPADYWCYAYHHVNGFEDKDGNIVFDTCTWDKFTLYFTDICSPNGGDGAGASSTLELNPSLTLA